MKWFFLVLLLFFSGLVVCTVDKGLEPTQSGFSGTLFFENDWPENTDQIIVVAATRFPPTEISDIILGSPLPLYQDTVDYALYIAPQDFAAVGVVWKQKEQAWDVTNIIGLYLSPDNRFQPAPVRVPDRNTLVTGIDIQADLSKAKRAVDSRLHGKLRTNGDWPPAAESVLVFTSQVLIPSSLMDIQFGQPIPAPFDSTNYSLTVQPGTYRLIGALLLERGVPLGVQSIRGLYYRNPGDLFPATVKVPTDTSVIHSIDIAIDLNNSPF